jgi:8-oxo-dGTP pyrophosphatase MutT (NUDIX family)
VWATTAGYVVAGEESVDAAIREVKEELGLQLSPSHLKRIDRHVLDNRVEDVWMAEVVRNTIGAPAPGDETADYKWISRDELEEWVSWQVFLTSSVHEPMIWRAENEQ